MRRSALALFALAIGSFLAWGTARWALAGLGDGAALDALRVAIKAALWLVPAGLYARFALGETVADAFALRAPQRAGVLRACIVGAIYLALVVALGIALGQPPTLSWSGPAALGIEAGNAAVEEAAFRGFLLLHLAAGRRFWLANLVSGLVFVGVHVPMFVTSGAGPMVVPMAISLLLLALVLGEATRASRSIWIATAIHLVNNLLAG